MCATESPAVLPAPELRLPGGPGHGGFLILALEGLDGQSVKVSVKLEPRMVGVVLALWLAMQCDADAPWPARGWRYPVRLIPAIARASKYVIEEKALRNYVSGIRTRIARAVHRVAHKLREPLPPHLLIEGSSGVGFRLAVERLVVVDPANPAPGAVSG